MDTLYEKIIRPIAFKMDPEDAHELALKAMQVVGAVAPLRKFMEYLNLNKTQKPINLFGIDFPNRVGLAAGFDKDAQVFNSAAAFGYGHIEIGTITKLKQSGNPKKRIFRYVENEAVVNSCGFPNEGADIIAKRLEKSLLSKRANKIPVGVNIGKSKLTPIEDAVEDYLYSFNKLAEFANFFVLNVSSPNTPDLRKLQGKDYLDNMLKELMSANMDRAKKLGKAKIPMLLKIAPDLTFAQIDDILEALLNNNFDGIVATNTTLDRVDSNMVDVGGMSGKPLFEKSLEIVNYISKATKQNLPIIGVGGITDNVRAGKMLNAGASLVQIYSGMIYRGPFFARSVAKALSWKDKTWI